MADSIADKKDKDGVSMSCQQDFHERVQSVMACVHCACDCHAKPETD